MCYKLTYKNTKGEWLTRYFQKPENATKAAHEAFRTGETRYLSIEQYEIKTED